MLKAVSLPDSGFPSFSPSLAWPCVPSRLAFLPWVQHTCMISSFSLSPNSALHQRGWPGSRHSPGSRTSCLGAGRGPWGSWPQTRGQKALLSLSPWWHPLPGQPLSQVASAPGLWELSSPVFVSWYCQRLPPVANFWFLFSSVWLLRVSSTCGNHLSALHSLCCKCLKWFLFYGHPGDAVPTALSLCLIPLCTWNVSMAPG